MKIIGLVLLVVMISGCESGPFRKTRPSDLTNEESADVLMKSTLETENEYLPYLQKGNFVIEGQAFMVQRGGGVVKAAGRAIYLDPATTVGRDWWNKVGRFRKYNKESPSSRTFAAARRTVTADADGRFKFSNVPNGEYYLHTLIEWMAGSEYFTEGGVVWKVVRAEEVSEPIILTSTIN